MKAHAQSQSELSKRLETPRSTLQEYLNLPDCPKKTKYGYHVEKIGQFIMETKASRVGSGGDLKDQKLEREIEILDLKIGEIRRGLISIDEHQVEIRDCCRILTDGLDEFEALASAEFPDHPRVLEIAQRLVDRVRSGLVAKIEGGE